MNVELIYPLMFKRGQKYLILNTDNSCCPPKDYCCYPAEMSAGRITATFSTDPTNTIAFSTLSSILKTQTGFIAQRIPADGILPTNICDLKEDTYISPGSYVLIFVQGQRMRYLGRAGIDGSFFFMDEPESASPITFMSPDGNLFIGIPFSFQMGVGSQGSQDVVEVAEIPQTQAMQRGMVVRNRLAQVKARVQGLASIGSFYRFDGEGQFTGMQLSNCISSPGSCGVSTCNNGTSSLDVPVGLCFSTPIVTRCSPTVDGICPVGKMCSLLNSGLYTCQNIELNEKFYNKAWFWTPVTIILILVIISFISLRSSSK